MKHDPDLSRLILLQLRDGGYEEQIESYPEQLVLEQQARLIDEGLALGTPIYDGIHLRWVKALAISTRGHQWLEALEASESKQGPEARMSGLANMPAPSKHNSMDFGGCNKRFETRPRNMPHVFISYVRENQALVDRLCNDLRQHGIEVWLDREQIQPGQRWKQAIRHAIEQGAFCLACFSAESTARDVSYMNEELTLAIDELRKRPTHRTWFVPVLLTKCQVPSRDIGGGETLHDLQRVSLWENWPEGIRRIVAVIKPGAASNTALAPPANDLELRLRAQALKMDLSEQAILILQQAVHSGGNQFFYADWGNGQWSLQFCSGQQAQLGVLEPNFIREDLDELVALRLLAVEYNPDGNGIYSIRGTESGSSTRWKRRRDHKDVTSKLWSLAGRTGRQPLFGVARLPIVPATQRPR